MCPPPPLNVGVFGVVLRGFYGWGCAMLAVESEAVPMAIDRLRFHDILVRGGMTEAPSIEFTEALRDTFEDETGHLATQAEVDRAIERAVERLERAILAVETRMTRLLLTFAIGVIGINLAAIATAVGIILGFN